MGTNTYTSPQQVSVAVAEKVVWIKFTEFLSSRETKTEAWESDLMGA